jgi:hypothetical protein
MAMVADTRHSAMRHTGVVSCVPSRVSHFIIPGKTIGMVVRSGSITGPQSILLVRSTLRVSTAAASTVVAVIADGRYFRC